MSFVKDTEEILELATELIKGSQEDLDALYAGEIAAGNRKLDDVEFMTWMGMLEEMSPREDWITPEGHHVNASPLILAMGLTKSGKADLERYQRLMGGQ